MPILKLGTIHKRRWQFFRIFDTPSPMSAVFSIIRWTNFDPPPLPIAIMGIDFGYFNFRALGKKRSELFCDTFFFVVSVDLKNVLWGQVQSNVV